MKKTGNIFANTAQIQSAHSPTNSVGQLKIDISRKGVQRQSQQQQLHSQSSQDSDQGSNRTGKFDQKVLNIDLSSNNSMSKRPNLFNEKSTSRERILTKQKTFQPSQKQRNAEGVMAYNTPAFNMTPQESEESKEEEYHQEQLLKGFPFLMAQHTNQGKMKLNQNVETSYLEDKNFNPFRNGSKVQYFSQKTSARTQEQQKVLAMPGKEFLMGLDTVSQSEVSQSPRVSHLKNISNTSSMVEKTKTDTPNVFREYQLKGSMIQTSQFDPLLKKQILESISTRPKRQQDNLKVFELNVDNISVQDRSDSNDETLNFEQNQLMQGQNDAFKGEAELQLSQIDMKGQDITQGTNEEIMPSFNRKEERLKTQIAQHLIDKILYEKVIPREIRDLAKHAILNFNTISKRELDEDSKKAVELYFEEDLVLQVMVSFLSEFTNVTDGSATSERALKRYIDEVLVEDVNFAVCSEVWNDCLLLPHIVKEDPSPCIDNMIIRFVNELAMECLANPSQQVVQTPLTAKESQQIIKVGSRTQKNQYLSHKEAPLIQPNQHSHQARVEVRPAQDQDTFAIQKYLEDNFLATAVQEEVEELVIAVMQDIYFMNKKIPQMVAEEILNDMLRTQIRVQAQLTFKKERMLEKAAGNFLEIYLEQELRDIAEDVSTQIKFSPFQLSDQATDLALEKVSSLLVSEAIESLVQEQDLQRVVNRLIDGQLEPLLASLASMALQNTDSDSRIVSRVSDQLIQEVVLGEISQIITFSIQLEKDAQELTQEVLDYNLVYHAYEIGQDCITQELAQEEYDGLIDKIIEFDIWRETVKDLRQEDTAIQYMLNDWVDNMTGGFFIDHFTEIKDEYLKSFKEQIRKQQEDVQAESNNVSMANISHQHFSIRGNLTGASNNVNMSSMSSRFGSSRIQEGSQQISKRNKSNSREQSFMTANHNLNNSAFKSVQSDIFYDCHNDNPAEELEEDPFGDILQRGELRDLQNMTNIAEDEEDSRLQTVLGGGLGRVDTLADLNDETMQFMEIDEGSKQLPTLRNYYVIPEIKSLDFLNLQQRNYSKYFQSNSSSQMKASKRSDPSPKKTVNALPIDAMAIDVLCVNCYECVRYDQVDEHSTECLQTGNPKQSQMKHSKSLRGYHRESLLPGTQQEQQILKRSILQEYFQEDLDLGAHAGVVDQDILTSLREFTQYGKQYNFEEGRYANNEEEQAVQDKIQEEREYLAELNERIFKLHKAVRERHSEEQTQVTLESSQDMTLLRHLDDVAVLAMNILTDNTNLKELEIWESELIDKIRTFRPLNAKELSLSITAKRLSQLALEKIKSLGLYLQLTNQTSDYPFDQIEDAHDVSQQIQTYFPEDEYQGLVQRSVSYTPAKLSPQKQMSEEQFRSLEEESKQHKAELEVWRNLHNEILKNYLISKAQGGAKHLVEISSDVSTSKNGGDGQISDDTSQFSSGASSFNASQFQVMRRAGTYGGQSAASTPRKDSQAILFSSSVHDNSEQQRQQTETGRTKSPTPSDYSSKKKYQTHSTDVAQIEDAEEVLRQRQSEELKRHFYTLAIQNSKKILKSIPQGQVLRELYNKCLLAHLQSTSDYFTSQSSELDFHKMESNMNVEAGRIDIKFTETPSQTNEPVDTSLYNSNQGKRKVIRVLNADIRVDDQAVQASSFEILNSQRECCEMQYDGNQQSQKQDRQSRGVIEQNIHQLQVKGSTYARNEDEAELINQFGLDSHKASRQRLRGKPELMRELKDSFIAPWDQDSPRQFLHLLAKPERKKMKPHKPPQTLLVQGKSQEGSQRPSVPPLQMQLPSNYNVDFKPIDISPQAQHIYQDGKLQTLPHHSPLAAVTKHSTPVAGIILNSSRKKQDQTIKKIQQLRQLYERRQQIGTEQNLKNVISVKRIDSRESTQKLTVVQLNQPASDFLLSKQSSPKAINNAVSEKLRAIPGDASELRKRQFQPLELSGKTMVGSRTISQSLISTKKHIQQRGTLNEVSHLHESKNLSSTLVQPETIANQFSEICKLGGVEVVGPGQGHTNFKVLKKTIDRYFMMRKSSLKEPAGYSMIAGQSEEIIGMIQRKREQELKSLVISKVGDNGAVSSKADSKRKNVQKTLNYFMKKQRSHVLLFKQQQLQQIQEQNVQRLSIQQQPNPSLESTLQGLQLDSKEYQAIQTERAEAGAQQQVNQNRTYYQQTVNRNAQRKFQEILSDLRHKLELPVQQKSQVALAQSQDIQLPMLNCYAQNMTLVKKATKAYVKQRNQ